MYYIRKMYDNQKSALNNRNIIKEIDPNCQNLKSIDPNYNNNLKDNDSVCVSIKK